MLEQLKFCLGIEIMIEFVIKCKETRKIRAMSVLKSIHGIEITIKTDDLAGRQEMSNTAFMNGQNGSPLSIS